MNLTPYQWQMFEDSFPAASAWLTKCQLVNELRSLLRRVDLNAHETARLLELNALPHIVKAAHEGMSDR